jgi:hypothetical protein
MTLSGITTLNLNAGQVITFALAKLGVVAIGQQPAYTEIAPCLTELSIMLKGWQTTGPHLWRNTFSSIQLLPAAQSYVLTADNPLRIVECRYRYPDGHDLPMTRLSRIQYATLPLKSSQGYPTQYYPDPQDTGMVLYVWPVLQNVTTDTFQYTFQRRFQVCTSPNNSIDIPEEWLNTVGYCLAEQLLPNYGVQGENANDVRTKAKMLYRQAKAFDRPAFVQFMPQYRPGRW